MIRGVTYIDDYSDYEGIGGSLVEISWVCALTCHGVQLAGQCGRDDVVLYYVAHVLHPFLIECDESVGAGVPDL